MDLRYTDEEEAFRAELRGWLDEVVPGAAAGARRTTTGPAAARYDTGVAAHAVRRRLRRASTGRRSSAAAGPRPPSTSSSSRRPSEPARRTSGCNFVGQLHAGPTLVAEASPEQKAVPPPRASSRASTSGARASPSRTPGSDLASLRTRADARRRRVRLNGQKIWTSYGHIAEYCEMLVAHRPRRAASTAASPG